MRRILVLGASGFIGRSVVARLADAGHEVVLARHRASLARGSSTALIEAVTCDLGNPESLRAALAGVTAVINCAGGDAHTLSAGSVALCDAARATEGVARIVHMSSLAVYGSTDRHVDEDSCPAAEGWYANAKLTAEHALHAFAGGSRDAVILRPGIVYGPDGPQWTRRVAQWLRDGRVGDLGAAGDGRCNMVHVDDVAQATVAALVLPRLDEARVINLPGGDSWTWNRYFRRFSLALRLPRLHSIGPARLAVESHVLAAPLRLGTRLLGTARAERLNWPEAMPPSVLRLFRQSLIVDDSLARAMLHLRWTALADGVAAVARTLR